MRLVLVGELADDVVMHAGDHEAADTREFRAFSLPAHAWGSHLVSQLAGTSWSVEPGGSIANVGAAMADSASTARDSITFNCVERPLTATLRTPFTWPGYSIGAVDLRARGLDVVGADTVQSIPELPGALAIVGRDGAVVSLQTNRALVQEPEPIRGDVLVVRSDHLASLPLGYATSFNYVAVLVADRLVGARSIRDIVPRVERCWVFGSAQSIRSAREGLADTPTVGVTWVATDGSGPVHVTEDGVSNTLPVRQVETVVSDLGAGDAYVGGFLAAQLAGEHLRESHESGMSSARQTLGVIGARGWADSDLNRILPIDEIDRSSKSTTEGRLYFEIRRSPGTVVITGGQTGVDALVSRASNEAGLPVHRVFPRGMLQEGSRPADPGELSAWGRTHELGSPSFRYRTWATVYLADVVVLSDLAGGEGSAETRRAARWLGRPLVDIADSRSPERDVGMLLMESNAKVVLAAGSRRSLMDASQLARARSLSVAVTDGVAAANRFLLRSGTSKGDFSQTNSYRFAIPRSLEPWLPRLRSRGVALPDDPAIAHLSSPRAVATALSSGLVDVALTWPSLLSTGARDDVLIEATGYFPIHYGFAVRRDCDSRVQVIQYEDAFRALGWTSEQDAGAWLSLPIDGGAEDWLSERLACRAYDTYRTGRALNATEGDVSFFPSHWETLSVISRR